VASLRDERLAANESLFRSVNEDLPPVPALDEVEFFCECSEPSCVEFIRMSEADYQAIHADPMQFLVKRGHEVARVETVVEEHEGYFVIRKDEDARPVVTDRPSSA
jgi:hypothetical protein